MDNRLQLPVNTLLDGTYRIERVLGSGGFGITYAAEDISLGTMIALKEYYPVEFGDRDSTMSVRPKSERHRQTFEWGRTSFLQEARMLARFRHPSIVRVTRVFEAHSSAYMVMDFEEGRSFEAWLQALGRPPAQDELDRIAAPLLDALEMMHRQNFLHRDIAPDNIIVRDDGTPVLLDFGAARRAVGEMSRSLTGIVKAGYSPQEQYATDSRLQGPWSDLYALGATFYRAVTGRPPEEATLRVDDDRTAPARAAAKGEYRPSFLAAIDTCLRVRQADRPQSVAQLRSIMFRPEARARTGDVAPATRKIDLLQSTRIAGIDARRWIVAAAVALAVLGGLGAGFAYMHWSEKIRLHEAEVSKRQELLAAEKKAAEERQAAAAAAKKSEDERLAKARIDAKQREERLAAAERERRQAEAKRREPTPDISPPRPREQTKTAALIGDIIVTEANRKSADECRSSCLAKGGCKAYEFRKTGNLCYLYRAVYQEHASTDAISGRWDLDDRERRGQASAPAEPERSKQTRNTALIGDIIVTEPNRKSADECRSSCLAKGGCKAYEFRKTGNLCYLYRAVYQEHTSTDAISGRWD